MPRRLIRTPKLKCTTASKISIARQRHGRLYKDHPLLPFSVPLTTTLDYHLLRHTALKPSCYPRPYTQDELQLPKTLHRASQVTTIPISYIHIKRYQPPQAPTLTRKKPTNTPQAKHPPPQQTSNHVCRRNHHHPRLIAPEAH